MLKSMTGYGRAQAQAGQRDITVEIRAINHRYFEFSTRIPRSLAPLEARIKAAVQKRVSRGKVDFSLTITAPVIDPTSVQFNMPLAQNYVNALRGASEQLGLKDDLCLSHLLRVPDLCEVTRPVEDLESAWEIISPVVESALDGFVKMRSDEGAKLHNDMLVKLESIRSRVDEIERLGPPLLQAYRERLRAQLSELLDGRVADEARITQEAAVYADRIAVDEETVRLRSHIAQFMTILNQNEPVGRKLDFLLQEFMREANTIGSKLSGSDVAKIIVEMKNDIEKVREQVQNIE